MERGGDHRGRSMSGSYTHVCKHPAEHAYMQVENKRMTGRQCKGTCAPPVKIGVIPENEKPLARGWIFIHDLVE